MYLLLLVPGINLELGALANDPCGANPFKENILPTSKYAGLVGPQGGSIFGG